MTNPFSPKIIASRQSKFSGQVNVCSDFGFKYISTGQLTQSGSLVKEVWEGVLKKTGRKNSRWLVLGLCGGTIPALIAKKYAPTRLVGVEIDPVMVELGKVYLKLDQIAKLEIVLADANKYMATTKDEFDYILVDTYCGDQLPKFVYSQTFIKCLKAHGQTIIFNHLFYDDAKKFAAQSLVSTLQKFFPNIALTHKLTNLLITCS